MFMFIRGHRHVSQSRCETLLPSLTLSLSLKQADSGTYCSMCRHSISRNTIDSSYYDHWRLSARIYNCLTFAIKDEEHCGNNYLIQATKKHNKSTVY